MLIDSNIVIYSALPEYEFLDAWMDRSEIVFSVITQIEVLGYSGLSDLQWERFEELFASAPVLPMDASVVDECIRLRRGARIKLGDAIIAATACVHHIPLVTRNVEDFQDIPGLQVINPFTISS